MRRAAKQRAEGPGPPPGAFSASLRGTLTFADALPHHRVRRIDSVRVPYLSLGDLRRSKETGRASDLADLEALPEHEE